MCEAVREPCMLADEVPVEAIAGVEPRRPMEPKASTKAAKPTVEAAEASTSTASVRLGDC